MGSIGITGREITGQEYFGLKKHMDQFMKDAVFGAVTGPWNQSIKGYMGVGLSTAALSLMTSGETNDIEGALKEGAMMAGMHLLGLSKDFKAGGAWTRYGGQLEKIAGDQATKQALTKVGQHVPTQFPGVVKGQNVPGQLVFDIKKANQDRVFFSNRYKVTIPTIRTQQQAVMMYSSAAKQEATMVFAEGVANSKSPIPQDVFDKEMEGIQTAKKWLEMKILPVEKQDPAKKALLDDLILKQKAKVEGQKTGLLSKIREPKIDPYNVAREQMVAQGEIKNGTPTNPWVDIYRTAANSQEALSDVDINALNQAVGKIPAKFQKVPVGNVATTGIGGISRSGEGTALDPVSRQTIQDYYQGKSKFLPYAFIVKDQRTASMMHLITQLEIKSGKQVTTDMPEHTLRIFLAQKGTDGQLLFRPAGYVPQQKSFNQKKNSLNEPYNIITNRLKFAWARAKTPEQMKALIEADRSMAGRALTADEVTELMSFKKPGVIISDADLYRIAQPPDAFEKWNELNNNINVSNNMTKNGISVLLADIGGKVDPTFGEFGKVAGQTTLGIRGPEPRWNPNNPFLSIGLTPENWYRSTLIKGGTEPTKTSGAEVIIPTAPKTVAEKVTGVARNVLDMLKTEGAPTEIPKTEAPKVKKTKTPKITPETLENKPVEQQLEETQKASVEQINEAENLAALRELGFTDEMLTDLTGNPEAPYFAGLAPIESGPSQVTTRPKDIYRVERQPIDTESVAEPLVSQTIEKPVKVLRFPKENMGNQLARHSVTMNEVVIQKDLTKDEFLNYFKGKAEGSGPSKQKQIIWNEYLTPKEKKQISAMTEPQIEEFLINHEKSHLRNEDAKNYPRLSDAFGIDLFAPKALEIETRAIRDALNAKPERDKGPSPTMYEEENLPLYDENPKNSIEWRKLNLLRKERGTQFESDSEGMNEPGIQLTVTEKKELADLDKRIAEYDRLSAEINKLDTKPIEKMTPEEANTIWQLKRDQFMTLAPYEKNSSLSMANKYGLLLDDSGFLAKDKRTQSLKFDPIFARINDIKPATYPEDYYGNLSTFNKDMVAHELYSTESSRKYSDQLAEQAKKTGEKQNLYGTAVSLAQDEAFKRRWNNDYGPWQTSYSANSALKHLDEQFAQQYASTGHFRSQPERMIAAQNTGRSQKEIRQNIAEANLETSNITDEAAIARSEAMARGELPAAETGVANTNDADVFSNTQSTRDPNQIFGVVHDTTKYDEKMNGLLTAEIRMKYVDEYNDMVESGVKTSNPDMVETYNRVWDFSNYVPETEKAGWKFGEKIEVNRDITEPSFEEGIKDGLNLSYSIFGVEKRLHPNKKYPPIDPVDIEKSVIERLGGYGYQVGDTPPTPGSDTSFNYGGDPLKKPENEGKRVAIIGTAGRKEDISKLTKATFDKMYADAASKVGKDDILVSGGAAWTDHLAVKLFNDGKVAGLELHLPAPIDPRTGKFPGEYGTAGSTARYYHDSFQKKTGIDPMKDIQEAISKGADVTYGKEGGTNAEMFKRNSTVAKNGSDKMIAYTFGEGNAPADGGTADTWKKSKATEKIHVPIQSISEVAPTVGKKVVEMVKKPIQPEAKKEVINGDIWTQEGTKVVPVNFGGIHGAGLAKQAEQQGLITRYKNRHFDESPGKGILTVAVKGNAPETAKIKGQAWSEKVEGKNIDLLKNEVDKLIDYARKHPDEKINLPFIGMGMGEGDPKLIMPILENAAKEPNIHLVSADKATFEKYKDTITGKVRTDARAERILNEKLTPITPAAQRVSEVVKKPEPIVETKKGLPKGATLIETPTKRQSLLFKDRGDLYDFTSKNKDRVFDEMSSSEKFDNLKVGDTVYKETPADFDQGDSAISWKVKEGVVVGKNPKSKGVLVQFPETKYPAGHFGYLGDSKVWINGLNFGKETENLHELFKLSTELKTPITPAAERVAEIVKPKTNIESIKPYKNIMDSIPKSEPKVENKIEPGDTVSYNGGQYIYQGQGKTNTAGDSFAKLKNLDGTVYPGTPSLNKLSFSSKGTPIESFKPETKEPVHEGPEVVNTKKTFVPNKGQQDFIDKVGGFLGNRGEQSMTLAGAAGTGKTSVLVKLLNDMKESNPGIQIQFTATTHAAAKNIKRVTGFKAQTAHSMLKLKPQFDLNEMTKDVIEQYKRNGIDPFGGEEKSGMVKNGLVIIDESSMLPKNIVEMIKEEAKRQNSKVIFVGDHIQLAPVKDVGDSRVSSVFDPEVSNVHTLNEVMRQVNDNPLLTPLDEIRAGIEANTQHDALKGRVTELNTKGEGIKFTSNPKEFANDIIKAFSSDKFKENKDAYRVLAFTNAKVKEYNDGIRKALGFSGDPKKGEIMIAQSSMGMDTEGAGGIKNSTLYEIGSASDMHQEKIFGVPIMGRNIELIEVGADSKMAPEEIFFPSIENGADGKPLNSAAVMKQLENTTNSKFTNAIMMGKKGDKSYWRSFYAEHDKFAAYNDIKPTERSSPAKKKTLDFGYASTIHKSQGATHTEVFVDEPNINGNTFANADTKNRLKYVALSRPTHRATVFTDSPIHTSKVSARSETAKPYATKTVADAGSYVRPANPIKVPVLTPQLRTLGIPDPENLGKTIPLQDALIKRINYEKEGKTKEANAINEAINKFLKGNR